ncbi:MAG TPA: peptidoglycan-binding protein [Allosphingosinicella sp.]|jgi:putative chitinase|nr:peptidoglycan-binding protein [Allosphingosinicella sp.]
MINVDLETLQAIMPRVAGAKGAKQARIVAALAPVVQRTLEHYEIDTPLRIAHFLAQCAHESDGFCTTEEYASGRAYEGRRDLGNNQKGDGPRYKGRGLFQLTGRANYRAYGPKVGIPDLVDRPERAADPAVSLLIACEYWKERRGGLNRFADQDDIVTITKAINGGTNGLDDRRRYLARAKQALARTVAIGVGHGQPAGARLAVRRGSRNEDVEALQRQLVQAGYPVAIDGDFGPGTETAVRAFQAKAGLATDGVVGPATWRALDSAAPAIVEATLIAEPKP